MKASLAPTIAVSILSVALSAHAQEPRSASSAPIEVLPARGDDNADTPAEEKKGTVTPAAGYAYADKPAAGSARRARFRSHGPVVNMPGFEQGPDGGSRLFVQLSQSVPVEERKAQGMITYVLKGASPRVWNNTNALVTVHFNTPVSRARLVPHGQDLHFVVELRAAVSPTWKVNEGQDKTATLAIDFPRGDFVAAPSGPSADSARATPRPTNPKRTTGKRAPRAPARAGGPNP
jgi:hypothetical protein